MRPPPGRGWGAPAAPLVWAGERPGARELPRESVEPPRPWAPLGARVRARWPSLRSERWQVWGGQNFAGAPDQACGLPPPWIPSASPLHPLPLGAPGGAAGGRAGGETESRSRERRRGAGGEREIPVNRKAGFPKMLCPGGHRDTLDSKDGSRCSQKAGPGGPRARTGTGENRGGKERRAAGRGGSPERGKAAESAESGGQDAEAAGTRAAAEAATGDSSGRRVRPRTGGSRHRPWAGDGLAPRGRGKGDRQASVWGPCQQLRFSGAASRGAEGPTGEKGRPG